MIRIKHILPLLLLALPLSITSCDSEPARIDFVQEGDYSRLLEAVRSADRSLSAKMALIENAMKEAGFRAYVNEWWHYNDEEFYPVIEKLDFELE